MNVERSYMDETLVLFGVSTVVHVDSDITLFKRVPVERCLYCRGWIPSSFSSAPRIGATLDSSSPQHLKI